MARLAAVDIGSNTVHVLVADSAKGRLDDVAHYVEMPSLGREVDRTGRVGESKMREVLEDLARVLQQARRHRYERLVAGATAAVRAAQDGEDLLKRAAEVAGVPVHLIDDDAEARLSFLGVASRHAARREWVMADLGGGSTEVVLARGRKISSAVTLGIGSGKLGAKLGDPPTARERRDARTRAARVLASAPAAAPVRLAVTGGTASNLARVLGRRERRELSVPDLQRAREVLDSVPALKVAERYEVSADRVTAMRGGVEVLRLLLQKYGLERLRVSHEGLRHGMILSYLEQGEKWFDWRR